MLITCLIFLYTFRIQGIAILLISSFICVFTEQMKNETNLLFFFETGIVIISL
jgi:hypothetical protein